MGMMLEEIDALCAESARRYVNDQADGDQVGFVTAAVDHLDMLGMHLKSDWDTKINTYVAYAGNSTLHVKCDVFQKHDGKYHLMADSVFIMAARKDDKPYKLPSIDLSIETDIRAAEARIQLGNELK